LFELLAFHPYLRRDWGRAMHKQNRSTLRQFEAVIALAEEMHFGRAAQRVGLTQSGMSRCIQKAEQEANTKLFERNRSRMEMTDSGRSYVEHARICVAFGERAVRSAKETKEGIDTLLHIGKSPDVDPVLIEILYAIRLPLYPQLEIAIHSESSSDLAHGLLSADLDLALITHPGKNPKLTMIKLAETPLYVVLPRENPLALKDSLKLADLRDERWVIFQKKSHPLLYDRVMKRTMDEGFQPKRIDHILFPDEAEQMLKAAPGVAFMTKANALRLDGTRFVARHLDEKSLCLDECLAARAENDSRLVSEFVRAFVTKTKTVLKPLQMSLPMGKEGTGTNQCSPS
jgi:DNA-binding transcriptional LysR family regulator